MKKYDTYKDSGIEWIGEIPSHWEVNRFKYLFFEHSGNGFPNELQGRSKGEIPFFKVSDLNKEGITVEYSNNYVSFNDVSDNGWNIVPEKSILTAKIGESLKKNHRKISSVQCIIDNNCLGIEPISINGKYAFYQLRIIDFDWFVNPGAIPSISMEKLRNHFFPISPSPEEQTAIANYLDHKTTEIDELIADKKRLLELYEEEKTAIINQAVTKGINPDVPMKDSGIEWLGEIPEHWKSAPLKYLGKFINGYSFKSTEFVSLGIRVLKISNIQNMRIDWSDESFIDEEYYDTQSNFRVLKNDLVFALTRPIISTGIKVAMMDLDEKILLNQRNSIYRPTEIDVKWIYYLLLSAKFIQEFDSRIDKTGQQPNISSNDIGEISIPVPPDEEQNELIIFIDKHSNEIDSKINKTKKLIDLLTEYRTTLISEVVTGKIKVTE